ncbi:helix-turn-helix transcriptional regulator, LysR family [Syntrophotalea carbinolica DSM 2380]|uniref:Helix-turn-helix transcriptional regulator, LysR family n=1 Tax=Syntrophotalea carbinolica (strain DSM 2380 / NBRC 103641 / GraBd1) TaxID=338963 RepID=Q3A466_SYNC1|nr:LysR family transcriptional regulator [Syntrophotalea carbinolica]ABA88841.1 helix-turn-helix transcriptional regulator, LysR family [Syntrophotalea carbinolica DSM 2380]
MSITLRKLAVFTKVAETGQATKSGELLLMSQPAISMALKELEENAGGQLFIRQGRRLILNDRGRLLLEPAQEILRRVARFENLLAESERQPRGLLRIGASTTIGNYLLPSLIARYSCLYTDAKASLQVGNTHQIEVSLDRGDIDLGLIEGPSHAPLLKAIPWRNDELVVIAGREHPITKINSVTADMLEKANWIMREPGSGTREVFEAALAEFGGSINIDLELGHTEAIKKAVEAGLGISCLSRLAVQRELENGWLVEISTHLNLTRSLTILLRDDGYRTKLLQSFLDMLLLNEVQGSECASRKAIQK